MSAARKLRRAADRAIAKIDGGLGASAIAAVAALPPGPRRDLEIALWVRRAEKRGEAVAFPITPTTTDAELAAVIDLYCAVEGIS